VAWPISTVYPEGCRYDTLCQISIGQEEVEEVIERDINRTFPEHPQFSFQQGQQELFRVLKAYSLHDLSVRHFRVWKPFLSPPPGACLGKGCSLLVRNEPRRVRKGGGSLSCLELREYKAIIP